MKFFFSRLFKQKPGNLIEHALSDFFPFFRKFLKTVLEIFQKCEKIFKFFFKISGIFFQPCEKKFPVTKKISVSRQAGRVIKTPGQILPAKPISRTAAHRKQPHIILRLPKYSQLTPTSLQGNRGPFRGRSHEKHTGGGAG